MVKDALRIAELEKLLAERTAELIQQGEELAVINSVQEALVKELDMQAIYDLIGNKIQELFDAQAVIISTFDHEAETEHFQYTIENGERFYPEPRPINKLRRHLIDSKQKVLIQTEEDAIEWFGKEVIPGTKFMKSGVFMPLISGDVVTSYISLQNVEKEHAFSDSEIRLLETLANSMSAALQNARLLKETEQRTAELAVINSVQEGLAKELDIQAIYDLVGNRIRELFDAQVVGIATFDHEKATEHIHYLIEKGERYYPTPKPIYSLRRHIITNREKLVINKNFATVADTFGIKPVPGTQQPKAAVYVPMLIGEKITGYVSLQNIDKENAFSESDLRLLETLANTMGVALENARLFDETTRLLKETEQRTAELAATTERLLQRERELQHAAFHDPLTELPNRRYLVERCEAALAEAKRHNQAVALLLIDLDHFKPINDRYGHDAGDQMLRAIAQRLRDHVRAGDAVARLGGDEFAVLICGADAEEHARDIARRLLAELAQPVSYGAERLTVTISIGVALYPQHAHTFTSLYKAADEMLYKVKARGRSGSAVCGEDGELSSSARLQVDVLNVSSGLS